MQRPLSPNVGRQYKRVGVPEKSSGFELNLKERFFRAPETNRAMGEPDATTDMVA